MQAGGLQGFQEPTGEADRDAVAVPEFASAACRELQQAWFRQRFAVEVAEQYSCGFVFAHIFGAIDVTVACPMLQGDSPLPARLGERSSG